MIDKKYDIAIIGAGPAGCAAAMGLGNSGLKVCMIDKAEFPREKICGDAIPGPAIKTLNNSFPYFQDAFFKLEDKQRIKLSRIMLENGRSLRYYWKLPAYNIKREIFDQFLLNLVREHTNTKILSGRQVKEISNGTPMIIHSKKDMNTISARMIIGCDGAGSITAKSLGHQVHMKPESVMTIRAYFKGIKQSENSNLFFLFKQDMPGYFWSFPLSDGIFNIGFGIKTDKHGKAAEKMKDVLDGFLQSDQMKAAFKNCQQLSAASGALLPIGGRKGSYSGDHYLLTGDAACLADPLQGHGIDKAIVSGLLAAHHSIHCFKNDDFTAAFNANYDLAIKAGIEKELRGNRQRQLVLSNFPFLLKIYSRLKKS